MKVDSIIKLFVIIAIILILLSSLQHEKDANAVNLGQRFFHCDTFHITTTGIDCLWTAEWYSAVLYADTIDVDVIIGAPDTSDWSSRIPMRIYAGMTFNIGPNPRLRRIKATTVTGTGRLYVVGYKNVRQY